MILQCDRLKFENGRNFEQGQALLWRPEPTQQSPQNKTKTGILAIIQFNLIYTGTKANFEVSIFKVLFMSTKSNHFPDSSYGFEQMN